MVRLLFVSLLSLKCALALSPFALRSRQDTAVPFVDPTLAGGSLIDSTFNGLGEPLNVKISSPIARPFALMTDSFSLGVEKIGYYIGSQLAGRLVGRWFLAIRECDRIVSCYFVGVIYPA